MPNPERNPDCPKCKGEGFYLAHEGQGYYRDGSFGHNTWEDCFCSFIDQKPTTENDMPNFLLLRNANAERQAEWPGSDKCDVPFRALELVNEVGELCGAVKKDARRERNIGGATAHRDHIAQEIGDTLICWDLLMGAVGIEPDEMSDRFVPKNSSFDEMGGVSQAIFVMDAASKLAVACHVPVLSEIRERDYLRKEVIYFSTLLVRRAESLCRTYDLSPYSCWVNKFNMTSAKNTIDVYVDGKRGMITDQVQWGRSQ